MRGLRAAALSVVLLVSAAAPARADWQFAPLFGITFKSSTTLVLAASDTARLHWNVGGTATLIGRGPLAVEAIFQLTPGFLEAGDVGALSSSRVYSLMGNVVVAAPLRWNEYGLRPFISGGLGVMHASQQTTVAVVFPLDRNFLGYNVGGGAIGFITERAGLRFDLRYYSSLSRTDDVGVALGPVQIRYWTGSVGVVLRY